ncbi:MAG TPA: GntR family transcriptional regulator [Vitreimonas sp.]|nr:GntR family transcriptional regulator [Vitreimonas sp.]
MVTTRRRPLLADVVRAGLRDSILSGEFPHGAKLPNEEQLCERFGVSRVTVREAVRGLIEDGYVVRRQGSGTYVTRRPLLRNSLDENFSYTAYLEEIGVRAGKQLLGAREMPADIETAEALAIPQRSAVIELRRVRTADQRPAIYSVDYLSAGFIDLRRDRASLGGSMYALLAELGHAIHHGEAILSPAVADSATGRALDVAPGTLLQYLKQVDYDADGRPVMLSHEWHAPSVIELRVYRRGPNRPT